MSTTGIAKASFHGGGISTAAASPARHLYNWEAEDSSHNVFGDYNEHAEDSGGDAHQSISAIEAGDPISIIKYSIGLVAAVLGVYVLIKLIGRERRKRKIRDLTALRMQERRDEVMAELIQAQLDRQLVDRKQRLLGEVTTVVRNAVDLDALEAGTCAATRGEDNSCAICLGEYEAGDKVTTSLNADCNHRFHYDCIFDWLSRNNKSCPFCRLRFVPEEFIIRDDRRNPGKIVMPTDAAIDKAAGASKEAVALRSQSTVDIDTSEHDSIYSDPG